MGRRGWAITIVTCLTVLMIIILVVRSGDVFAEQESNHWEEKTISGSGTDKVIQLFVEGVIAEERSFGSSFDAESFMFQLDQVLEDDNVKAVVIRVNSPGGGVVASDDIHQKILEVKAAGKPVVVSMGTMAASGGYYIAAPADRIFANSGTLTGSLGVIFSLPNYQGAAEWIGYKEMTIQSGDMKDIGNPLREMKNEEKEVLQAIVDESYEQFVDVIAAGRNLPREQVYELADGRLYTGKQAEKSGLIDEIGSLEDATEYALQLVEGEEPKIVRYEEPFSFSNMFMGFQSEMSPPIKDVLSEVFPGMHMEPGLKYMYQP
jgi:protease-4